jgi:hypothetical protein
MRLRKHNSDYRPAFRGFLPRRGRRSVSFGFPLFAMFVLGLGGCPSKPTHSDLGKNGLIKPPMVAQRDVDTTPPVINSSAWPLPVFAKFSPPTPPPVRHSTTAPEPEPEPIKAEAPQISPQLSDAERSRAQASAGESMRLAQQNLDSASGKKLNANQQDMADKIRGFLKQAQEAIAVSDWNRASSLAGKAKLLSDELVKSLRS